MALTLALSAVAALSICIFGQLKPARLLMAASLVVGCIALPAELYVDRFLVSQGCDSDWTEALSCPEVTPLIKAAIWHNISAFVFLAYLTFVFPVAWGICAALELFVRFYFGTKRGG